MTEALKTSNIKTVLFIFRTIDKERKLEYCDGSSYVRNDYYIKLPTALETANCVGHYVRLRCRRIQLVYIDSYLLPFCPFSSLFSLVSSISAIYRAPFILR